MLNFPISFRPLFCPCIRPSIPTKFGNSFARTNSGRTRRWRSTESEAAPWCCPRGRLCLVRLGTLVVGPVPLGVCVSDEPSSPVFPPSRFGASGPAGNRQKLPGSSLRSSVGLLPWYAGEFASILCGCCRFACCCARWHHCNISAVSTGTFLAPMAKIGL